MPPIYLDYNATTPLLPEVADAMRPFLTDFFGNPSSSHWYGIQARQAVARARKQVSALLECEPDQIIFTSGGSESNNLAIKGAAFAAREKGNHIITSAIEHPAVTEVCRYLESAGFDVTYLPVDAHGLVHEDDLVKAIRPQTILITIMHANNEVGTIQPIKELSDIARRHGIIFHTDAAQSAGKIPVSVKTLGVDLLTVAGHKLYAPKGIGALYVANHVRLAKLIHGAAHEQDRRAGTENVLEIAGLGQAAAIALRDLQKTMFHTRSMRDRLEQAVLSALPFARVNGHPEMRLPNTLSVSFPGIEANTILDELREEVAASAGAACHTDRMEISSVLKAMRVPEQYAMGTIRLSVGRLTTEAEVDRAAAAIRSVVQKLHKGPETPVTVSSEDVKLTQYTHGLGCACKIRPQDLEKILVQLPKPGDTNILVGTETSDDAAVYKINDQTAIIQTVDFFTPVVDDPYTFGAIAAANAFSDIYAMGGRPVFALNIVGFPVNRLPMSVLEAILRGARDKAQEAGVSIIGGHSIEDPEPKFGMAVTGFTHPGRILRNVGAHPGDALVITKPIGTGIITTAMKRGMAGRDVTEAAVKEMTRLNDIILGLTDTIPVFACTDITGFGLLGHLKAMIVDKSLGAEIWKDSVPVLAGVRDLALNDMIPGGTRNNLAFVSEYVAWDEGISITDQMILCDAQTSGGLLMAAPPDSIPLMEKLAAAVNQKIYPIGTFVKNTGKRKINVLTRKSV